MERKYTKITKTIPEHTEVEIKTTYVAFDGKEFNYQADCERYEERLLISKGIQNIPHKVVECYDEEYPHSDWYFIRTREDAALLAKHYHHGISGFVIGKWVGVGWRDGGDSGEYYSVVTLDEEIQVRENALKILREIDRP